MFYGYYLSAAVMVKDDHGPAVPELARRITAGNSSHDPAAALAGVLASMPAAGIGLGDILADSGYSHRVPATWAEPLRAAGAQLVHDLHPNDRGPRGTHHGATIANGNLYCPATPRPLLELGPLPPGASPADVAVHDRQTAELARYKLGLHAAEDAGGYRRPACPAAAGKIRCPLRPASMKPDRNRPEILTPPQHPPACCTQQTITAGPASHRKPGRNTTTHQRHGGTPTGGAPPPNDSTPPSRTPPPTASTAAGSASPASPRSRSGSPASWPCATSAPWPPSRPGKNTTRGPPSSRAPANAAAKPPALRPRRPSHARQPGLKTAAPSIQHRQHRPSHAPAHHCPASPRQHATRTTASQPCKINPGPQAAATALSTPRGGKCQTQM